MRIDHFAYQKATRVAGFGLLLQGLMGLLLLLFGLLAGDSAFIVASTFVLIGLFSWMALVLVFHQHRLERLESLEIDELEQRRMTGGSAFDADAEGLRVQARRLELMHKWLMPIVSLVLVVLLVGIGLNWFRQFRNLELVDYDGPDFQITEQTGWAVAICLGLALIAFIFSRFVAGMSKLVVWQNLRGGAGYMVGNALVCVALAVGVVFTFLDNDEVIRTIARGVPYFMIFVAGEIVLNLILNLYRPRRLGEVPRPAFDSKVLSLLSAPDSIVRSINEAVNYQFGFDITSSWGYQLLVRRVKVLVLFAAGVMVLLNCIVIVEPHQQAVRLRGGAIVGGKVYGSGPMFKLPWPFERAEVVDVTRIRELPLTAQWKPLPHEEGMPRLWSQEIRADLELEPFLVATTQRLRGEELERQRRDMRRGRPEGSEIQAMTMTDEQRDIERQADRISDEFALIDAEIVVYYHIRADENGLFDWLNFSTDIYERRQRLSVRERALKELALREVTQFCSSQQLEAIIASDAVRTMTELRNRIQAAFDRHSAGVEVTMVSIPWVRPSGAAANSFEELAYYRQQKQQRVAQARKLFVQSLTMVAGSARSGEAIAREIEAYDRLRNDPTSEPEAVLQQRFRIEEMLLDSGGMAANKIAAARSERWVRPLTEEARAKRFAGRLEAYRRGPEIYREYLIMDVLTYVLRDARKYFIAMDPSIFDVDIEILQDDQSLSFEDAINTNRNESQ